MEKHKMSVVQHFNINTGAGVLVRPGVAWGGNALQTVTIARNTPKTPVQGVGYRGVVDYTSGQVTTELTLDCILTEETDEALAATSVYKHGEQALVVNQESYVLTSCAINFQAGNPATVNYGYLTAGLGSSLEALTQAPDVLTAGEEAVFAVVLGSDGSGIALTAKQGAGDIILPSGIQTIGFQSNIARQNIMDVRASQPFQFATTYPIESSLNLELFDIGSLDITKMSELKVVLAGLNNHVSKSALTKVLVHATGLTSTGNNESVNVGGYLTRTFNFTVADLLIPLSVS
jgi:hypothetical protein